MTAPNSNMTILDDPKVSIQTFRIEQLDHRACEAGNRRDGLLCRPQDHNPVEISRWIRSHVSEIEVKRD